jgi:hypothetical protein
VNKKQIEPIFIGGGRRSGTSLLRGIVGSHKSVAIFPFDIPVFKNYYEAWGDYHLSSRQVSELLKHVYKSSKHEEAEKVTSVPGKEKVLRRLNQDGKKGKRNFFDVACAYLGAYAEEQGRDRWGLKNPGSEFYAEDILNTYPNAKFIHVVRDPRDVLVSIQNYEGISFNISLNTLKNDTSRFIGGNFRSWNDEWRDSTKLGLNLEKKYPKKIPYD